MKRFLGIAVLILSFSANQLAFGQCFSTCNCRQSWEVLDSGCSFVEWGCCGNPSFPSCYCGANSCCYWEYGYCSVSGCGFFYFKKCFLGTCNGS